MLPTVRFRQIASLVTLRFVSSEAPYKPLIAAQNSEYNERVLGLLLALSLHLVWFGLMPPSDELPTTTPPQTIRVEWIGTKQAQPASAPKPAISQPTQKTVNKLKTPLTPLKQAPVLSSNSHATSTTAAPETTAEPPSPAPIAATATTQAAASPATRSSDDAAAPLSLPNLNADYLNNPAPPYPSASRESGEQGKVLLRVLVNADGLVDQITLRKSSGYERLDQAAQETVQKWRFVPARRGEQLVSAWVVVPVSFSLEG